MGGRKARPGKNENKEQTKKSEGNKTAGATEKPVRTLGDGGK